jgi:hypothetical protein
MPYSTRARSDADIFACFRVQERNESRRAFLLLKLLYFYLLNGLYFTILLGRIMLKSTSVYRGDLWNTSFTTRVGDTTAVKILTSPAR